mmetsp:Transcript_86348/g.239445  ORF Transcript_86348/g.239445 Transcript_86348/m.239445 type:complete len:323 (-) Transcript_86348:28-996(-)
MASSRRTAAATALPVVRRTNSMPSLPPARSGTPQSDVHSKKGGSDAKRMLHVKRERQWLRNKAKDSYMDFSDTERAALRRYFDALAESNDRISLQRLENMLISLGLADNRREVEGTVERINSSGSGELDFEEYLELVRTRTDSNMIRVFQAMMEGKLGDQNLHFHTVLSTYRRQLMLDATGARSAKGKQQELGVKVLENFAALQRARHAEAVQHAETVGPFDLTTSARAALALPFAEGPEPAVGPLEVLWRSVCREQGLYSSRPASADGRSRRTVEKPQTPEAIIQSIVKVPLRKQPIKKHRQTIVIQAPGLEEGGGLSPSG